MRAPQPDSDSESERGSPREARGELRRRESGNAPHSPPPQPAEPLDAAQRARGRRLAISSHPMGMCFQLVFTQHLPTLALVALGASETVVGLQSSFRPGLQAAQLPALRAVGRVSKRRILVAGQAVAIATALPLLAFGTLRSLDSSLGVAIAVLCFAATTLGIIVSDAVWFPLLRSYVEPERIGRFFGAIRSGWHAAMIVFYLAAWFWLEHAPGAFAPLFAVGIAAGLARLAMIWRLPERSERTGEPIRIRQAFGVLRDPALRRYAIGIACGNAVRFSAIPFAIVMLRREAGFSSADVLVTTIATFAGGLASLLLWGRAVDRLGATPIFLVTNAGLAAGYLMLLSAAGTTAPVATSALLFFVLAALAAGFGVADTQTLFRLTPPEAPARVLISVQSLTATAGGLAPFLFGVAIDAALTARPADGLSVYRAFFALAALLQLLSYWPLRGFGAGGELPSQTS